MKTIYKDCDVIILPAEDSQINNVNQLYLDTYNKDTHYKLRLSGKPNSPTSFREECVRQHLYIIASHEKIREDDYWIYINPKEWNLPQEGIVKNSLPKEWFDKLWDRSNYKKVIASTDLSLGKYIDGNNPLYEEFIEVNIPSIPQSFITFFIEEYNKGNVLSKVQVEYVKMYKDLTGIHEALMLVGNEFFELKINQNNTISIKPIKESWNREELREKLLKICRDLVDYSTNDFNVDNWINQNL